MADKGTVRSRCFGRDTGGTNPKKPHEQFQVSSSRSKYSVIADTLESELSELSPNSLLPTEDQMARRFGVSRITIRSALELLENNGLISRLRGRGTIVSPKKLVRNFSPLQSFESDMRSQNIAFETRVLNFENAIKPPRAIAKQLQLPEGGLVSRLSLIRLVNDLVVCHDHRYYPKETGSRIDPQSALHKDCSDILEKAAQTTVHRGTWDSEIMSSSEGVAAALGIADRTLVFTNHYTWFDAHNVALEAGQISYRVDRCKFRFNQDFKHPGET